MAIINTSNIDFEEYLANISYKEGELLKSAWDYRSDVRDLAEMGNAMLGDPLPWSCTHDVTRLGTGKLSIWAGESGSGKSLLLGQVMTSLLTKGKRVAIASFEMQPRETLYRMICQSATCKATWQYSITWLNKFESDLFIYDQLDTVKSDRVLGMAHYSAHELNCDHIVIDSLTKCGIGRDWEKQAEFVDRLQWCAKTWGVHIHLVCHMRKGDGKARSGKNDIRGAAEITDLADNVFVVSRNKEKEAEIEKKRFGQHFDIDKVEQPCAFLEVAKNREWGHEPTFGLYYDQQSGQYMQYKGRLYDAMDVIREAIEGAS